MVFFCYTGGKHFRMQKRSHRHLVAIPATLLLLLCTLAAGTPGSRAQQAIGNDAPVSLNGELLEATTARAFAAAPGVQGVLENGRIQGSDALSMELVAGAATVRAAGAAVMTIGEGIAVHGARTAWYVLRDDASSLVVALASPIAVSSGGNTWYLQAGQQLSIPRSGEPKQSTVPQQWLQQRLAIVARMPADAVDLSALQPGTPLQPLREAIQAGRMDVAAAFMRSSVADSYLRTEQLRPLFAALLAAVSARGGADGNTVFVALECTKALHSDVPFGRLLSLSYASGMVTDAQAQDVLVSQFEIDDEAGAWASLLLQVERGGRMPLPDAFITRWSALAERVAVLDPSSAARLAIDAAALSVAVEERGYPVQSQQWADAARSIAGLSRSVLAPGDRDALDAALAAAFRPVQKAEKVVPQSVASSADAEPQRDAKELVALTKQALLQAGGMFATTTSFVVPPRERNAVRVLGVLFATSAGDVSFDLTYHPLTDTVDKIVLKGRMFPNALTLRQLQESL